MKIDLHIHTKERSPCGCVAEEDMIRAAIRAGLDAIAITDHHRLVQPRRLYDLNTQFAPFRIYGGVEITVEGEDFLVLGLADPRLERNGWAYPELLDYVRSQGGFIAFAHPYRYHPHLNLPLEQYPPDAIEVHSPNTPVTAEVVIRALGQRLGVPLLSNSDAHTTAPLGRYYNRLDRLPRDEADLIAMLKAGDYALETHLLPESQFSRR